MNFQQFNALTLGLELKTYGLNPSEWSIQRIQTLYYRIQNRTDQDFTLMGTLEIKNRRPHWKHLEVVSL